MSKEPRGCPAGKRSYGTWAEADEALRQVRARRRRGQREKRVYRCPDCGLYHLTRKGEDRAGMKPVPPEESDGWLGFTDADDDERRAG